MKNATRKAGKKKAAKKAAKKTTAKKAAAKKTPVQPGKLGVWVPAKSVRVRRSGGKTLVDIKR